MPVISKALLRKRAEHNEGMLSTLEEVSLHQEELEGINEVLGVLCRKIKILYLQNNIIPKMENLYHLKDIEYLNLALNNIQKIEGLQNCEFIKKLDLTANFIDVDTLKESIAHLESRTTLRELYLMGNPAQVSWDKLNTYVIAHLPQLSTLDGTEITRSMRIKASQALPAMENELAKLAEVVRAEKAAKIMFEKQQAEVQQAATVGDVVVQDDEGEEDENELTENTPETRVKIYKELAQQKKEKEDRSRANQPKERDYDAEHAAAIAAIRKKEEEAENTEIKQKNEGGWEFFWDEDSKPGSIVLDVRVAKFLDSSLIDVDLHPNYVSIVIKSKTLRLRLPSEIKVSESKCQRSKTTGSLMIIMPKLNPKSNLLPGTIDGKKGLQRRSAAKQPQPGSAARTRKLSDKPKLSIQEQMMQEAVASSFSFAPPSQSSDDFSSSESSKKVLKTGGILEIGSELGVGKASRADFSSIVRRKGTEEEILGCDILPSNATADIVSPKVVELS